MEIIRAFTYTVVHSIYTPIYMVKQASKYLYFCVGTSFNSTCTHTDNPYSSEQFFNKSLKSYYHTKFSFSRDQIEGRYIFRYDDPHFASQLSGSGSNYKNIFTFRFYVTLKLQAWKTFSMIKCQVTGKSLLPCKTTDWFRIETSGIHRSIISYLFPCSTLFRA